MGIFHRCLFKKSKLFIGAKIVSITTKCTFSKRIKEYLIKPVTASLTHLPIMTTFLDKWSLLKTPQR